ALVAADVPTRAEEQAIAGGGRTGGHARHAAHRPALRTVLEVVGLEPERARHNEFLAAAVPPGKWRRKTAPELGPIYTPYGFARALIQRQQFRAEVLV